MKFKVHLTPIFQSKHKLSLLLRLPVLFWATHSWKTNLCDFSLGWKKASKRLLKEPPYGLYIQRTGNRYTIKPIIIWLYFKIKRDHVILIGQRTCRYNFLIFQQVYRKNQPHVLRDSPHYVLTNKIETPRYASWGELPHVFIWKRSGSNTWFTEIILWHASTFQSTRTVSNPNKWNEPE